MRCYAILWVGLSVLACACGAPRATRIEGDLAAEIERGMAGGEGRFDHRRWDAIVREHAESDGRRFDYAGLKADEAELGAYLDALAAADLSALGDRELQALFINAYNAYTVRTILDHVAEDGTYAIESIQDIPDVFVREQHVVGGHRLSLDNIEHNVLRPIFRDPRVHFAVNCASISCPPLPVFAFTADQIDSQLEEATQRTLRDPAYVSVENGALLLTKILDWYGGDFVSPDYAGSEASLPAYVRKYATDEVRRWIDGREGDVPVRFRDYDWALNRPAT